MLRSVPRTPKADPVGLKEIAERLRRAEQTVMDWNWKGVLPQPRWTVGGRPAWDWNADIEPWARKTGRLKDTGDREP